jgi:hypothetical protein
MAGPVSLRTGRAEVLYLAVRNLEDVGTVSPAQMDFTCRKYAQRVIGQPMDSRSRG